MGIVSADGVLRVIQRIPKIFETLDIGQGGQNRNIKEQRTKTSGRLILSSMPHECKTPLFTVIYAEIFNRQKETKGTSLTIIFKNNHQVPMNQLQHRFSSVISICT